MHSDDFAKRATQSNGRDAEEEAFEETDIASDEEMDGEVDAEGASAIERRND